MKTNHVGTRASAHRVVWKPQSFTSVFFLLLFSLPLWTACGPHDWGEIENYSQPFQQQPNATTGARSLSDIPGKSGGSTSQGRSGKSIDIPAAKEGCDGFRVRNAQTSKPKGTILAVMEARESHLSITPLLVSSSRHVRLGTTRSVSFSPEQGQTSLHTSLDGNQLHTVQNQDGQAVLQRQTLFAERAETERRIVEQTMSSSLQTYRGYTYLVSHNKIQAVDMAQSHKPLCKFKAPKADIAEEGLQIHRLVRTGNTLLGLHDSSYIKYVFVYKLQANGLGAQKFGAPLPSRPGLRYHRMVANHGILAMYGTYEQDGITGHLVASFRIESKGLMPLGEYEVKPHKKAHHSGAWQGLTTASKHILVGSQRGGVQVFDNNFKQESRTETYLGGTTTDLITRNDTIYALVHQNEGAFLKVLSLNTRTNALRVIHSQPLPGHPTHFVR
ncbi:MAG: hypothetical protein EP343_06390 [Deltaproteobacteria bacterium]|nr:MAG: hypothetical protein EP343_06390 [Deltaproteobacteria bacterium]